MNVAEREHLAERPLGWMVLRARTIAALLFAALVGVGCDSAVRPPVPEPPDALVVTAVLEPGATRQRLLLSRVSPADDGTLDLVQDATVRIEGVRLQRVPADSVDRRAARRRDTYNYVTDSLEIAPGQTYQLIVEQADHEAVYGRVEVPGSFTGEADGLRITWTLSEGAGRYRVKVVRREADGSGIAWERVYLTTDTSVAVEPDEDFRPGEHWVTIQAIDENLAAFQREETDRAGVEGAFGVFGAVTAISGTVSLAEEDAELGSMP